MNSQANDEVMQQNQVIPIGTDFQNSIEILNNRFRVDSDIKEITIVFFRSFGSPPVVLVRPDGSKLFLENDLEDDSFNWYETDTYDMISLKKPMPGPWQAVGDILPTSRIMVIAGVTLHADPIPKTIFSGETLKHTAYLENAGSRIDMSKFRDIVTLSIEFVSTNNPDYPNFGLGSRPIARFDDNGLGFDEYEADGIFTGQFDLKINEGEWRPVFTVRTPLFSREHITENVILRASPIQLSHRIGDTEQDDHMLTIAVDQNYIEEKDFVVRGTVRHPSSELVKFSLTEPAIGQRNVSIDNSDYGIYKVDLTVFAKTLEGREVILTLPEYSFVTKAPIVIEEPIEVATNQVDESLLMLQKQEVEEPESFFILAIVVNVILLFVGILVIAIIVNKRNHPNNHYFLKIKNKIGKLKKKGSKVDSDAVKA